MSLEYAPNMRRQLHQTLLDTKGSMRGLTMTMDGDESADLTNKNPAVDGIAERAIRTPAEMQYVCSLQ